ncbi:MAG: TerC/Alx family metal homeostasis membrane protein [Sediminibacterium sp.]
MIENLGNHPAILIVFSVLILGMLVLDLGVFNKNAHRISSKEAATWTLVWITLSMLFSVFILKQTSVEKFSQFQSAYWIEKALSVDNLFVFILVFNFFKVPEESHHKVLFWGIIGALFMRALFIFSGVGLINYTYLPAINLFNKDVSINLVLSGFGLFLIYAGIKSWFADDDDEEQDFSKSKGARLIHKLFKVSDHFDKDKFFTIENGVKIATPLLVVVGVIEFTDLLFAVDSIPAIFSIAPDDPFILYTSNIFAILGLRSMYFLLSNFIHMFSKLKYGLAIILTFIGLKMVISPFYHIDTLVSLLIVLSVLVGSVVLSILSTKTEQ